MQSKAISFDGMYWQCPRPSGARSKRAACNLLMQRQRRPERPLQISRQSGRVSLYANCFSAGKCAICLGVLISTKITNIVVHASLTKAGFSIKIEEPWHSVLKHRVRF